MLTPATLRAAHPRARPYKLFDGGGLFLFVAPTGLKSWRVKYRRAGREQLVTLGRFPELGLIEARGARDAMLARIEAGAPARVVSSAATLSTVAAEWQAHNAARWSPAHAEDVAATLANDVLPRLGERPIASITPTDVLDVLRAVEERGSVVTAQRLRQRVSGIFAWAISQELCSADPAALIGRAMMAPPLSEPHRALTRIEDCRALLTACEGIGAATHVVLASRFLALTAVRYAAVRGARWDEIEGLDSDAPTWRVPAARMKLVRAKKGLARFDHLVPLSPAAVAVLRAARAAGSDGALIFARRGRDVPIGEGALRQLYRAAGWNHAHVPHGWRSSFSTILNEVLPGQRDTIDKALAHAHVKGSEGAYNRAQLLAQRRAVFDAWGAMLLP